MRGSRLGSALAVAALLAAGSPTTVHAAEPITEATAHAIGVQAYVYLYPLVTMDITRRQLTNVARAEGISAPLNSFANIPEFPSATMKAVVRPNFDTLYSSGVARSDQGAGDRLGRPIPDGRYYLLPMLDMWTDVFASPGWRTTGTQARQLGRGAAGLEWLRFPAGVDQRSTRPPPYVWIIGRTKTDGPADYDAVHKIQAGYQDHAALALGQAGRAGHRNRRSRRRYEDTAEGPGRHHAGRQILRLCRRDAEAAAAAPHRSADRRPDAADRHRAGQELRPRQGRSGDQAGARERARGRAEADGVEGHERWPGW